MYQLMTFFMITDPATSVSTRNGRILVVFLIALTEMILRLMEVVNAPLFALFLIGPVAMLIEMYLVNDSPSNIGQPVRPDRA